MLTRFPSNLEQGIRAMARRWGYADDELANALHLASADPDGWLRLVEHDEVQAADSAADDEEALALMGLKSRG